MSRKIELEVEIDPDGNVRIETHGLEGEDCMLETESLERQLGRVSERTRTAEYYAKTSGAVGARSRSAAKR
jgi:hypothetical protein